MRHTHDLAACSCSIWQAERPDDAPTLVQYTMRVLQGGILGSGLVRKSCDACKPEFACY